MKTPLPVTLDDLIATAKDNRGICSYGALNILIRENGSMVFSHGGRPCSKDYFVAALAEYGDLTK